MYFTTKDIDLNDIKIQEEELTEVRWFSMEQLKYMVEIKELNEKYNKTIILICHDMNVVYVDSSDEGLKLLRNGEVCFFIDVHADTTPITATFYYDGSNASGRTIRNLMLNKANEYTYQKTSEFLADFGITINKDYFHAVTFLSGTKEEVTVKQVPFALEVACVVSIILMFGLAYSMSRDNETKIFIAELNAQASAADGVEAPVNPLDKEKLLMDMKALD